MTRVVLFNKPFNVLSQFTDSRDAEVAAKRKTLGHYIDIPEVYVAGRLDRDSEGLLVLTDSGKLQHKLTHPEAKTSKTYWAQVEGQPDADALSALTGGIALKDGMTQPAKVQVIAEPKLWPRDPPIRFRRHIPTTWLQMTLTEGRNRQVRRMCAAVGYPVLRLIRYRVASWTIDGLAPGESKLLEWDR